MAGLMEYTPEQLRELQLRNMKQVGPAMKEVFGERVPNARLTGPKAAPVAEAAKGGAGLLGKVGRALASAPALGAQLMLTPGELGASDLSTEQRAQMNPGEAEAAAKYAQSIQDRTKIPPTGKALLTQSFPAPERPKLSKTTITAPEPQVKAVEAKRQTIEAGAKEQLKTSQLSRPQAAEAVVKADCERKGIDPTPAEKKKMVAEEIKSMRSMDNDNLAKYLSYAIMGVGFLAGGSSEAAGAAWGDGFNRGYSEVINRAAAERKFLADQAQLEKENELAERKVKATELDTESKVGKRTADVETAGILAQLQGDDIRSKIADRGADNLTDRERLALDREKNSLYADRTKAQIRKMEADAAKAEKPEGVNMDQKVQMVVAEAELKDRGFDATEGVIGQYAAEKRRIREQRPDVDEDILSELAIENLGLVVEDKALPDWFPVFGSDKKNLKLRGQ